jgi:hypothetical protein
MPIALPYPDKYRKYIEILGGWLCAKTAEGEEIINKIENHEKVDIMKVLSNKENLIFIIKII